MIILRDITADFKNDRGIKVYYNDITGYVTIARGKEIIYEFYDGDTWERAVHQILYTISKY